MLKLSPRLDGYISDFLKEHDLVRSLVSGFGSPLNIVFPAQIGKNIAAFGEVYAKRGLGGKIFYAHKVNGSSSLVREASRRGISIDVASGAELADALANGFAGERIEATGPKNDEFITLGLQHGVLFNADNISELEDIIALRRGLPDSPKTRVLLRVSGFSGIARKSRFGTDIGMFGELLDVAKSAEDAIDVIGVSFHVDSVEAREKVAAISESLRLFGVMRDRGFHPRVLDIGGGFKVNYLESGSEWRDAVSKIKESARLGDGRLTWNGYSYGMSAADGTVRGSPNVYSYYNDPAGADYLDSILSVRLEEFEDRTVAEFLSDNMIELYIEPGRAMLDQAGISLARVIFSKKLAGGGRLVGLDAKANDLVEQDGFIDPLMIGAGAATTGPDDGFYLAGSLCAEADMISRRRFFLGRTPEKNDILAFANTAGYFMDFHATSAAMKFPAPKVAVCRDGGAWRWATDGKYVPKENR
jgi:diaminopimelate decarboxylase